jgi:CO dehydrogenase maturation factor
MTTTLAVAGKGGTGKTTVAGLLVRYLIEKELGSVLARDADPSSNLNYVLGLELDSTVGDIREDMLDQVHASYSMASSLPGGMSKQDYLDYQIQMALVEGEHVDLLAMGRPEGQGCYCAANQMMRVIMDRMSASYDYVVMDNEAGMEHISRRTTRDVDHLFVVTDMSLRSLIAAKGIVEMVPGLEVNVGQMHLVVNRVPVTMELEVGTLPGALGEAVDEMGIGLIGTIRNDDMMAEYDALGRPLVELPNDANVVRAVYAIADKVLGNGRA